MGPFLRHSVDVTVRKVVAVVGQEAQFIYGDVFGRISTARAESTANYSRHLFRDLAVARSTAVH